MNLLNMVKFLFLPIPLFIEKILMKG